MIKYHCTASIGVVVFFDHEKSAEEIFKEADMTMYQSKRKGATELLCLSYHDVF